MDALQEQVADLDYAIGDRVNTLMHRHGFTRKTLGAMLGIGPSAMSLKVGGQRPWSATEVQVAASHLNVSVAVLFGDEPMPEPTRPAAITKLDPKRNADRRTLDYGSDGSNVTQMFGKVSA